VVKENTMLANFLQGNDIEVATATMPGLWVSRGQACLGNWGPHSQSWTLGCARYLHGQQVTSRSDWEGGVGPGQEITQVPGPN
jgi:hypothetical protein